MALSLITQGFQVRVLGMDRVGVLGAAQYTVNFFQILIDFGFIMSATAKISQNREDKPYLNRILTRVVCAKLLFMILSYILLFIIVRPALADLTELIVYALYLFSTCMLSLLPDFMYRGLEKMSAVTVRAVSIKVFATVMIFLFVRKPADYWMVPAFSAFGNMVAVIFVYRHLYKKVGVRFCKISFSEVWEEIRESAQFFVSKAASAVNANLGGVLLARIGGSVNAGLFSSADKVISAARNALSPIGDSLYPHMVRHKDFSIIKKALLIVYPIILIGCAAVFIFAKPLLTLWLGEEGEGVVLPLRLLLPAVVFAFPNTILGFPTLGAMGLVKYANISVSFGTAVYIIGLLAAHFTRGLDIVSICVMSSVTELSILIFRLVIILSHRSALRSEKQG